MNLETATSVWPAVIIGVLLLGIPQFVSVSAVLLFRGRVARSVPLAALIAGAVFVGLVLLVVAYPEALNSAVALLEGSRASYVEIVGADWARVAAGAFLHSVVGALGGFAALRWLRAKEIREVS